jgi:hypothetical protein
MASCRTEPCERMPVTGAMDQRRSWGDPLLGHRAGKKNSETRGIASEHRTRLGGPGFELPT